MSPLAVLIRKYNIALFGGTRFLRTKTVSDPLHPSIYRRAVLQRLATRLAVAEDEPHPSPELVNLTTWLLAMSYSPALPSACPTVGRAGAANHRRPAVSSGQPRTTAPQVNPPVRWQVERLDLAYNDEVTQAAAPPSRLANEAVVSVVGPHPAVEPEPSPPGASVVVLASRATRVP
jgi:hypothetical protein